MDVKHRRRGDIGCNQRVPWWTEQGELCVGHAKETVIDRSNSWSSVEAKTTRGRGQVRSTSKGIARSVGARDNGRLALLHQLRQTSSRDDHNWYISGSILNGIDSSGRSRSKCRKRADRTN